MLITTNRKTERQKDRKTERQKYGGTEIWRDINNEQFVDYKTIMYNVSTCHDPKIVEEKQFFT